MFDAGSVHSVFLNSADICSPEKPCQNRILRIIFEAAPSKRISVNIHPGCPQNGNTEPLHLKCCVTSDFCDEIRIPARSQRNV